LVANNTKNGDLLFLNKLLESREVTPVIDKRYPLDETAEAIRYVETNHARGWSTTSKLASQPYWRR
jgi:NADPH:quinone reductase-like Zn-dependent oxidoreductase